MTENLPIKAAISQLIQRSDQADNLIARGLSDVHALVLTSEDDSEKLFRQGMLYRYGEGAVKEDDVKAKKYFLAAANLNHAGAQFELATLTYDFTNDINHEKNLVAIKWWEKSISLGYGPAQYHRAQCNESTNDLTEERCYELLKSASSWYEEQAKAGDADSQYHFALMHRGGKATGSNRAASYHWMKAAANQGYRFACSKLGNWLLVDDQTEAGTKQGIYWLTRAAELGDAWTCGTLGHIYMFGHMGKDYEVRAGRTFPQRIIPDKNTAISWYERQHELGSSSGAFHLGKYYLFGEHLHQDLELSEKWLLISAEAGSFDAKLLLGSEYASGERFKRDLNAAVFWLTQCANQGAIDRRYKLARVYEESGRAEDYVQAYKWYELTIKGSRESQVSLRNDSIKARDFLLKKMTSEQIDEAQKLAREWIDNHAS